MDQFLPISTILQQISVEAQRERAQRNSISLLHPWWARLTHVVARAAVYTALTQENSPDESFINELCAGSTTPDIIREAQQRIGRAFSQRETIDESEHNIVSLPQVLDLFSGGGVIPLEALRLGCETYALDLNPVAYLLQLCTLYYPQQFGEPTSKEKGSTSDRTWAGLANEVQIWSRWVHEQAKKELGDLYPAISRQSKSKDSEDTLIPIIYFRARTVQCLNTSCNATIPLVRQAWLVKKKGRCVALRPELDYVSRKVSYSAVESNTPRDLGFDPKTSISRNGTICPFCNTHLTLKDIRREAETGRMGSTLLAAVYRNRDRQQIYLSSETVVTALPDDTVVQQRIQQVCQEVDLTPPEEPISDNLGTTVTQYGLHRYQDLFNTRQLLTLLTYVKYIHLAYGEMHSRRIDPERAKATTTYLGLLLDRFADINSTLNSWQPQIESIRSTYSRIALAIAWDFAELNPFASESSEMHQTDQAITAIEQCVRTGLPAHVSCGSATHLSFKDEFFDAIVTSPPYYDNVAYAELSDLFYVWLKRSIGHLYPSVFNSILSPKAEEIIVAPHQHGNDREAAHVAYEHKMGTALAEAARVLKSAGLLTLLIPSSEPDVLQAFLSLAQKVGLKLLDAKRIDNYPRTAQEKTPKHYQVLLILKKSQLAQGIPHANANAETVLHLVDEKMPVLYSGLVDLLSKRISPTILQTCIPSDYQGDLEAKLKEYIADCEDPRAVLKEFLGIGQILIIAGQLELGADNPDVALDEILRYFGFTVPVPPQDGSTAAMTEIEQLISRLQSARDKVDLRGVFMTSVNRLEKTLRDAAWAWGHIIFGESRDDHLRQIVEKSLDRLAMGDVKRLFCELPDYVVKSSFAESTYNRFGRHHPYKPKKYVKRLDKLIALRNKVEHNKDGYNDVTSLHDMKSEFSEGLILICSTLRELRESGALPMIVRPIRETTDMYGRCCVELQNEDGTTKEIYVTAPIELGCNYLNFRVDNNPRPVDPPMLLFSEVFDSQNQNE